MGISTVHENGSGREGLFTAAALCVVPGLGQIYNGEARKGLLYFCAGAANALFLLLICVKGFLLSGARTLGASMHVRLNPAVLDCLHNIDMRSPQMLLLCFLLGAFTLFCLRDAVQTRQHLRNREIYANEALAISEAASGSYVFHALMFVSMFLLVLFLFVPPEVKQQVTDITFVPEQPKTTKPIHSKLRSKNDSENGGKVQTKPVLDTPKKAQSSPGSRPKSERSQPKEKQQEQPKKVETPKSQPAPKPPTPEKTTPQQVSPSKPPVPHFAPPTAMVPPAPMPQPANLKPAISVATPTPALQPTKTSNTSASNSPAPLPLLAMAPPSQVGFAPAPTASNSSGKTGPSPAPAPASSHRTPSGGEPSQPGIQAVGGPQTGDSSPRPSLSSGHPNHSDSTNPGKDGGAPVPHPVSTGGSGHGRPLAVAPVVPGAPGGTLEHGGPAAPIDGDPSKPTGIKTRGIPDYGRYMDELQRRIKHSWFPPRAPESKKVIVVFTIHQDGELSNVHVLHSSGDHVSDEAAIRAVEHAAPFMPLPKFSDDTIDVQFTFDYNLFTGHSSGVRY